MPASGIEIRLQTAGAFWVRGTVRTRQGTAAGGFERTLTEPGGFSEHTVLQQNGRFLLTGLTAGTYTLSVRRDGSLRAGDATLVRQTITVRRANIENLTIVVP